MAVEKQRLYTVDEFEIIADSSENSERLLELINGEVREKLPTEEHGMIVGNILAALWVYVRQHKSGRVGTEIRHRSPDDDRNARLPDVSYISGKRPVVTEGSVPQMPDVAIEVLSPTDNLKELREKARYYLAHGTKIVWLVIPEKQLVEVYTPDEEAVLDETDTLSGGGVLPGFTLPVEDVFLDPAAE